MKDFPSFQEVPRYLATVAPSPSPLCKTTVALSFPSLPTFTALLLLRRIHLAALLNTCRGTQAVLILPSIARSQNAPVSLRPVPDGKFELLNAIDQIHDRRDYLTDHAAEVDAEGARIDSRSRSSQFSHKRTRFAGRRNISLSLMINFFDK